MGHSRCAGRETRKVLLLLRRTLHRHILQYNSEAEDSVLHRQLDCALRGYILPVSASVLFTRRFQGEDFTVHHDPPLPNHVFLAHIRNHSVDVAVVATAWQIPIIHYAFSCFVRSRNHNHHQYTLQVSKNKHNITIAFVLGTLIRQSSTIANIFQYLNFTHKHFIFTILLE